MGSLVSLTQALIPQVGRGGRGTLVVSPDPNHLPKAHLLTPLHWRVRLNIQRGQDGPSIWLITMKKLEGSEFWKR